VPGVRRRSEARRHEDERGVRLRAGLLPAEGAPARDARVHLRRVHRHGAGAAARLRPLPVQPRLHRAPRRAEVRRLAAHLPHREAVQAARHPDLALDDDRAVPPRRRAARADRRAHPGARRRLRRRPRRRDLDADAQHDSLEEEAEADVPVDVRGGELRRVSLQPEPLRRDSAPGPRRHHGHARGRRVHGLQRRHRRRRSHPRRAASRTRGESSSTRAPRIRRRTSRSTSSATSTASSTKRRSAGSRGRPGTSR
jgi:hypothetical protein